MNSNKGLKLICMYVYIYRTLLEWWYTNFVFSLQI